MRRRKRNYNYSPYGHRRRIRWDNVLKVVIPVVVVLVLVITFNFCLLYTSPSPRD